MTRDEALAKLRTVVEGCNGMIISGRSIEMALDGYVALGMLKLDEPKTERDTMLEIVKRHTSFEQARCIENAFVRAMKNL